MNKLSQRLWNKRFMEVASAYLIIIECQKCGSPCNQGYVCMFCGDTDPRQPKPKERREIE